MWKSKEFTDIGQDVLKGRKDVKIEKKTIKVKGSKLFYQEFVPTDDAKSLQVLLLHGASFTSETWIQIGTFQLLSAMKYRVVALDIPGYGKSQASSNLKLEDFIGAVNLDRPVIVSPSMSGGHSLPYIFSDADTWTHRVRGYIPVAPVGTSRFQVDVYKRCQVPTLHVVGKRDTVQGKIGCGAMKDLSALPNIQTEILEDAGHACYMNQTDKWHRLVYNFLTILEKL